MKNFILKRTIPLLASLVCVGTSAFAAISPKPVTADATEGAQKLYTFLYDNFGKKTISGVQTGDLDKTVSLESNVDVAAVYEKSGKYPALVGLDFLNATGPKSSEEWFVNYNATTKLLARQIWQKGGIPAYTWHWKDPSNKTGAHSSMTTNSEEKTDYDYTKAFKSGTLEWDTESKEYKEMVADIDSVSSHLLDLQKDGVACIWRPLHEASGAWFWWGIGTGEQYKAFYKLVYDRMVKENGVKNCIWVWNIERTPSIGYDEKALDPSWYPGDEYVDIIAVDVYKNAYDNGSLSAYYKSITSKMGSDKIIALSENGPIPDVEKMHADDAVWSWWMPWYDSWGGGYISQTKDEVWKSNMSSDKIITLDEMGDWGTYTGAVIVDNPCELNTATHIEAECADYNGADEVASDVLSGGKAICVKENNGYINFEFDIKKDGKYEVVLGGSILYGEGKEAVVKVGDASAKLAINENGGISVGTFKLSAGKNIISVVPGWTWWVVDYLEVIPAEGQAVNPSASLSDPDATESAKKLYSYLYDNFGKNIISGFMAGNMDNSDGTFKNHEDFMAVYERSGKYPALGGVDFMNATGKSSIEDWYKNYTKKSIAVMEDLWKLGGIPAFTWHWRDPSYETDAFYYEGANKEFTTFDFTTAMKSDGSWDESSQIYKNIIADIDVVANYFLSLQEKGIAGIFRPLHEASGGWFWWGTKGGNNYAKLFQLVRREMVEVKGVHNLVWVWNPQSTSDESWNPGAENYDVISIDIYNEKEDYQSNYVAFDNLKKLSDYSKIIALSENGPVVDADKCVEDEAMWSWMMPWYQSWNGNFADQTSNDEWKKVMAHENVITLDEMPGCDKYEASLATLFENDEIKVFPTNVDDKLTIASTSDYTLIVYDASGKVINTRKGASGVTVIPTNNWSNGTYIVSIEANNGAKKICKIIK